MRRDVDRSAQRQLDGWLMELARADRDAGSRPALEARTLAAWDEARAGRTAGPCGPSRPQPRAREWVIAAVAGLAAALLAALAIPFWTSDARPVRPGSDERQVADASRRDAVSRAPNGPGAASPVGASGERPGSHGRRVARERREPPAKPRAQPPDQPGPSSPVSAPPDDETVNFLPLGPDVERELTGSFQLARVRVSRDVLVDLGLLADGHRGGEPVQADVVFGEDGLARAIRLTPVARTGRIP